MQHGGCMCCSRPVHGPHPLSQSPRFYPSSRNPTDCEDRRLQSVDPKTVAACAAAQVRATGAQLAAAGFAAVSVMSKRGKLAPLRTVFYQEPGERLGKRLGMLGACVGGLNMCRWCLETCCIRDVQATGHSDRRYCACQSASPCHTVLWRSQRAVGAGPGAGPGRAAHGRHPGAAAPARIRQGGSSVLTACRSGWLLMAAACWIVVAPAALRHGISWRGMCLWVSSWACALSPRRLAGGVQLLPQPPVACLHGDGAQEPGLPRPQARLPAVSGVSC